MFVYVDVVCKQIMKNWSWTESDEPSCCAVHYRSPREDCGLTLYRLVGLRFDLKTVRSGCTAYRQPGRQSPARHCACKAKKAPSHEDRIANGCTAFKFSLLIAGFSCRYFSGMFNPIFTAATIDPCQRLNVR